jgi:predicted kinase
MKTEAVVYVMCGFIGAGKTTFARDLEKRTGAVRITKDEWLIRLMGNDPTVEGFEEYDHRICDLSRDVAFDLAAKGIDVILDEGFWEREQRDTIRERINATGAKGVWYYLDTPIETIRERVAGRNNNLTNDSFSISREMLDNYLTYWQPPGEDEEYLLVREEK